MHSNLVSHINQHIVCMCVLPLFSFLLLILFLHLDFHIKVKKLAIFMCVCVCTCVRDSDKWCNFHILSASLYDKGKNCVIRWWWWKKLVHQRKWKMIVMITLYNTHKYRAKSCTLLYGKMQFFSRCIYLVSIFYLVACFGAAFHLAFLM